MHQLPLDSRSFVHQISIHFQFLWRKRVRVFGEVLFMSLNASIAYSFGLVPVHLCLLGHFFRPSNYLCPSYFQTLLRNINVH